MKVEAISMTRQSISTQGFQRLAQSALVLAGMLLSTAVWSQASAPSGESPQGSSSKLDAAMPPGVAAKSAAVKAVEESQGTLANRAVRDSDPLSMRGGLVTQVGTGRPVGEGSRVLRLPGKCSPKTNSLDCVAEAGQAPHGANVSSRVRNSVIGEVGAGRSATEGSGTVKRKEACTPQAGKLTCE
jgi:hypothetical protein